MSTGRDLQHQPLTTKDKTRAAAVTVARRILEPNNYHRATAPLFNFFFFFEKDMQLSIILKGSKKLLPHPSTIRNLQLEQPRASPSNVLIHCQAQAKLHLDLQAGVQPALQGRYTSPGWHNPPARTCCTATNSLENIQLGPDEPSSSREEGRKRQWQDWG